MSTVLKLTEKVKPPRPTKAAIAKLKSDPTLAPEFDAKFGPGAAALNLNQTAELTELMRDLIEGRAELAEQIAELIDVVRAPRQAIFDQEGNVAGSVPMTNLRLDECKNEWYCAGCKKAPEACTCDAEGGLLKETN